MHNRCCQFGTKVGRAKLLYFGTRKILNQPPVSTALNVLCFFLIKPTRCTNFINLFWHETLHVSDSSSVHHQEFIHCTLSNGMCHTGLWTAFEQDQDRTTMHGHVNVEVLCFICDNFKSHVQPS
jgi:hypothetical protein